MFVNAPKPTALCSRWSTMLRNEDLRQVPFAEASIQAANLLATKADRHLHGQRVAGVVIARAYATKKSTHSGWECIYRLIQIAAHLATLRYSCCLTMAHANA
jgi:hypothetical protein